jgi:hypothetical protein
MEFNVSKCAIMQTTNKRSKTDFPYKMKGETLQKVDHQPYLGVELSNNLKYNLHIDQTCKKASKVLGFLKRNLKRKYSGGGMEIVCDVIDEHQE